MSQPIKVDFFKLYVWSFSIFSFVLRSSSNFCLGRPPFFFFEVVFHLIFFLIEDVLKIKIEEDLKINGRQTQKKMEENLKKRRKKWKTTSKKWKMEDDLEKNWKTTSKQMKKLKTTTHTIKNKLGWAGPHARFPFH